MFGKSIPRKFTSRGEKKAECMCAARAKGCHRGRIFLLSETTVGVEMFLLYKKAPVDLLFVIMQEKWSRSRHTYRFMSEEANGTTQEIQKCKTIYKNRAACAAPCSAIDLSASAYLDLQFKLVKSYNFVFCLD